MGRDPLRPRTARECIVIELDRAFPRALPRHFSAVADRILASLREEGYLPESHNTHALANRVHYLEEELARWRAGRRIRPFAEDQSEEEESSDRTLRDSRPRKPAGHGDSSNPDSRPRNRRDLT